MVQLIMRGLLLSATCMHATDMRKTNKAGESSAMIQPMTRHGHLLDTPGSQLVSTCAGQEVAAPQEHPFEKLTFVHIPRTGGRSIVDCTSNEVSSNDRWGLHTDELQGINESVAGCNRHKVPPNLLDLNYYRRKINQNTFCVVRDPFARLISQHGDAVRQFPDERVCTKKDLNQYLLKNLKSMLWDSKTHSRESSDCHFLPQVAYTHGWNHKRGWLNNRSFEEGAKRHCKHILHFEDNLSDHVNEVFQQHGYPYRLQGREQGNADALSPKKCNFKPEDLADHVVLLAERLYDKDFEEFGYRRLSTVRKGAKLEEFTREDGQADEQSQGTQEKTEVVEQSQTEAGEVVDQSETEAGEFAQEKAEVVDQSETEAGEVTQEKAEVVEQSETEAGEVTLEKTEVVDQSESEAGE